ncbi:MAG TPA: class A beta-lactamase [Rhizomicrobium sp.]|nr:class A beta-lactamase [Rhizomicrobium sp.]
MLTRRTFAASLTLLPLAARAGDDPEGLIAQTEKRAGGRLGLAALDTGSGRRIGWRADERFPMCSTFKLIAVSALLKRVDEGRETLSRRISYGEADLLDYAPITRAHVKEGGMALDDLCAAAIQWSDNTAANLVLARIGGPAGATAYARALGDNITRIDRNEPDANTCIPGDPRDTTSPNAMLDDLNALAFGRALSAASRAKLLTWLANWQTRLPRLEAGLPAGWKSAHKMGTGRHGTSNDVAILWPPGRAPILVAAYYTGSTASLEKRDAVLADVGRIVSGTL